MKSKEAGLAIKLFRKERGLSSNEIAKKAGVSRSWVTKVENGYTSFEDAVPKLWKFKDIRDTLAMLILYINKIDVPNDTTISVNGIDVKGSTYKKYKEYVRRCWRDKTQGHKVLEFWKPEKE